MAAVSKRNVWLLVVAWLLSVPASAGGQQTRFPGDVSELASPDGHLVLVNVDSDQPPHHALYLRAKGASGQEQLLTYGRHASALWSLRGHGLIINDYGGSDYSNSLIFLFGADKKQVDVREELRRQVSSNRSLFGNHHVYIEGVGWLDDDRVKVKVSGYGDVDPKGFTLVYEYTIGGGFRLLKRTASFSEPGGSRD